MRAALAEVFEGFKKKRLNRLAKETGFCQRQGMLQPYDFLVLMTLGQFGMKHPSLGGMIAAIHARLSREALHQRFTAAAALFLQRCLHAILHHKLQTATIHTTWLQPFGRVLLVDSSSWDVSPKLQGVLPGAGGNASMANCKIQVAYDYKQGELIFLEATAGTVPDNRYTDSLPALLHPRDLMLFDQGYFKLHTLNAIIANEAYFLTRFLVGTTVWDAQTQAPIELSHVLAHGQDLTREMQVRLGQKPNQTPPCRLVCLRVSPQVAAERRRRVKAHARKQGRTARTSTLMWGDWTLLSTNVPQAWLPLDMVRALYSLRWQIELVFKQFKSILHVHHSTTGNVHRLRCELYGKLIAAVLVHRIHAWANSALGQVAGREISFEKLYKRLQERAFHLAQQLVLSFGQAMAHLARELEPLLKHCQKYPQRSRMTTLEMLDARVDPKLFTRNVPSLA